MKVRFQQLDLKTAMHVATNMSNRDKSELLAMRDDNDIIAWAKDIVDRLDENSVGYCALVNDVPVAVFGMTKINNWMCLAWAVGTDDRWKAGKEIYRECVQLVKRWFDDGYTKMQCYCLDSPTGGSEWLERMGWVMDGKIPYMGKDGEDFRLWGLTRKTFKYLDREG